MNLNFSGKNIESYNVKLMAALLQASDSYLCLHGGRGQCEETEEKFSFVFLAQSVWNVP